MKKATISLFLISFMISLFMTGCGKDEQARISVGQQSTAQNTGQNTEQSTETGMEQGTDATIQWNASHFPMPEQYEAATVADGKIYACRYGENGLVISVFTTDSIEQTGSYEIPGVTELKSISVDVLEQICIFGSTEDGDTLWQISPDGSISTIEDIEVEDLGEWPSLKNFYADSNGFYYLWYGMDVPCSEVYEDGEKDVYTLLDRIYVKDQQMNTIVYEQIPDSNNNKLVSLIFDENGIPMLLARDEDGYYMRRVRTTEGEQYEPSRLEINEDEFRSLENSSIIAYTQNGLLYTQEGSLHLYHTSDSQDEKLLELAGVGILEEDIIYLGMRDSKIEIIDNYKGFQQSEYTAVEAGENQRTQLTLGIMQLDPEMMKIIASFNRYQNEVAIEPVLYYTNQDYEAGIEKMNLEIIQGKAPDLICVDGLNYDSLANMGAFTDLHTFMQQDTELDAGMLVSSVLHVYEVDGHLYTIAPAFRIYTMWGAGSMIEGRKGISVEEMMQMLRDHGGDINSIYGFSADESVLTTLCAFHMDKFVNWEEGTCDFTGTEFQQVVRFVKEYKGKIHESLYTDIQNGSILLELGLISSVEDYRLASEIYGENIQFIGCPTEQGTGSAVFFSGDKMAVNSGSKYQDEAWEFMKFFIQNGYNNTGFPLMREQFDQYLNESMKEETVTEDGVTSQVARARYHEPNVIDIMVVKCEPEDVEAVRELVDSVSVKFQYHTEIQKIIEEEVGAYLHDQKSMEEVCSIIQNRVQLYLNERQ